ncbi:hypothetical protein EV643_12233 [Kribbella sp. VKM Ac-2527]|uniref:Uncharacterized protein n=1 Tax=Kribbella caucasensis TaxID=2512215 RepID=A0A4R6JIU1_9ACTN|nr:hypothetical protein [Kribbella sp. VKM Ac-2527]TDO35622.1 hypothetical protein EV643_12233 [Kribbella sp. VKM Ac-2527]
MVTSDFRNDASAAYEVSKELGPEYERAVLESFVANATESINQQVDARLAQHGVGPAMQQAPSQLPMSGQLQMPGQQMSGQLQPLGRNQPAQKQPKGGQGQPDNSHLAVPVFSLLFGVGGSIWLTAGAHAESDSVFAMWLGIVLVNLVFGRMFKRMR